MKSRHSGSPRRTPRPPGAADLQVADLTIGDGPLLVIGQVVLNGGNGGAGPRALGQRSVLADPRHPVTRERINRDIKHREPWCSLAPAVHARAAPALLGRDTPYPFMIVAADANAQAREQLAAAVHVDGSLRPRPCPPTCPAPTRRCSTPSP